ncbi:hypothetical protein BC828DRAFT_437723 [Blastocladiella britannica]|nr:hypothetical protein BC828DRAFT_437723 [Blastocladiella britannica]
MSATTQPTNSMDTSSTKAAGRGSGGDNGTIPGTAAMTPGGPTRGTAGPVPGTAAARTGGASRTQHKLMLQKDQLETEEQAAVSGAAAGSPAIKFAKEIERIDREYATVARFHDPLGRALARVAAVPPPN